MPKRKGIIFSERDVSHITRNKQLDVGKTTTHRYLKELNKSTSLENNISPHFFYGKIHFKPNRLLKGKRKAQKVFLKPIIGINLNDQIVNGKREVKIFNKMRKAQLPVPKAGIVVSNGQAYIAVESFLRKGNSKSILTPINTINGRSTPTFLKKLNVRHHSELIKALAKDLATLSNIGLSTEYFDIHGFYKRQDGSIERIIMDVNHVREYNFDSFPIYSITSEIKKGWRGNWFKKEKKLFVETLLQNVKDPTTRERFRVAFYEPTLIERIALRFK
jgi:hypothetical protein